MACGTDQHSSRGLGGPVRRRTRAACPGELEEQRLAVLLEWHETFLVSTYERHPNARIHARQGNRNPFIDSPEWAGKVPLARGLG